MCDFTLTGQDGIVRCSWPGTDEMYVNYHDKEWGFPENSDVKLFEKISLEGFQSGLAWITILRKRENFRRAFSGFDIEKVAKFGERKVQSLLKDEGIVRHEGKIRSVINNSQRAIELIEEQGSLMRFFWLHTAAPNQSRPQTVIPSETIESSELSKDLKKRGWTWIGPTTIYSFMQAVGMVNDHVENCAVRETVEKSRREFLAEIAK